LIERDSPRDFSDFGCLFDNPSTIGGWAHGQRRRGCHRLIWFHIFEPELMVYCLFRS
jgi:hypothetical protein